MTFHIQIAEERRTATETPMGLDYSRLAIVAEDQLITTTAESITSDYMHDPHFITVVEWDLRSPYVVQHKGDYSARTMGYAGWPDLTKEQFDAMLTPDPL